MTVTDSGVLLITHGKGLARIKPGQKELVFNLLGETLISIKTKLFNKIKFDMIFFSLGIILLLIATLVYLNIQFYKEREFQT